MKLKKKRMHKGHVLFEQVNPFTVILKLILHHFPFVISMKTMKLLITHIKIER